MSLDFSKQEKVERVNLQTLMNLIKVSPLCLRLSAAKMGKHGMMTRNKIFPQQRDQTQIHRHQKHP